jgi:predicted deacetylase
MPKTAQYLIRIDDVCPTMNWAVWQEVENILIEADVKPMLAVVPDNQDDHLKVSPPRNEFWHLVRAWRERGWTIGLHGYQHTYVTREPGIIGINRYSEFAGLPMDVQAAKLRMAFEIFRREGIQPDVWVAPAHSFDGTTVGLLRDMGLRRISDGFFLFPNLDSSGMLWIPQQIWRFRAMPFGVWCVCLHVNTWGQHDLQRFRRDLKIYRKRMISVEDAILRFGDRRRDWRDRVVAGAFPRLLRTRLRLRSWLAHMSSPSPSPDLENRLQPDLGTSFERKP